MVLFNEADTCNPLTRLRGWRTYVSCNYCQLKDGSIDSLQFHKVHKYSKHHQRADKEQVMYELSKYNISGSSLLFDFSVRSGFIPSALNQFYPRVKSLTWTIAQMDRRTDSKNWGWWHTCCLRKAWLSNPFDFTRWRALLYPASASAGQFSHTAVSPAERYRS